jgi:uncharacterized protein (DUF4415 family)
MVLTWLTPFRCSTAPCWRCRMNVKNTEKTGGSASGSRMAGSPSWLLPNEVKSASESSPSERQINVNAGSSKKRSRTNWKKIDSLPDSKIDYSDLPELDTRFFRQAIRWPGKKQQITLRLDPDILTFFRRHGKGYQTTINAILRSYMEMQKNRTTSRSAEKL